MPYRMIVLVKQVPDTKAVTGDAMKEDGTVNRAALPAIFNPDDLFALDMAVHLKRRYGGTVKVLTMGPPRASEILRDALYRGADEGVLLTDRKFAAADTLATSYTLAEAVRKMGEYDILLCGRQAIDGDTAQVGPQVAEKLGLPQISYVEEVFEIEGDRIKLLHGIDDGWETSEARMPILLTVLSSARPPTPPAAKRIMKYKKARSRSELSARGLDPDALGAEADRLREKGLLITEWSAEDTGLAPDRIGLPGSPTKVKKVESVVLTGRDFKFIPSTDAGITVLLKELVEDHTFG